ncbi:transmembrane protein, putative (macronuclear) [Tetrahymena thermophila SB210]|uniref:Transmembrane protein, putative n=1 Tax=Tetrahymena thermophila (strain SB210) TaxID=312017 RepID=Q22C89_TETTS|nr:transmembrane protein, putative [Tetrahymena thermophila SB210]EAR82918.1 transmembrane protein, putative [Tetrahymena thermophila SB210]|eukprot:XP_001030581.1 transmembrane protein, putative [Tetrahymena thermophila SB210]
MAQKQFLLILLIALICTSNVFAQCRGFVKDDYENKNSLSFIERFIANLCEYTNISDSNGDADQNNINTQIDQECEENSNTGQ